jgi:hypothetical protein
VRLRCSVCRHSKVLEINDLLTIGTVTGAEIAAKFGLGEMAVSRHRRNCIGKLVSKAMARRNDGQGDRLLSLSQKWIDHADRGLDSVAANNDYRTMPGLLTAGLKAVETVARLEGRPGFGDGPQVNATVQIALVKLPSLGSSMAAGAPVIDVAPVRGHLASGVDILEGDCEDAGETNCEG